MAPETAEDTADPSTARSAAVSAPRRVRAPSSSPPAHAQTVPAPVPLLSYPRAQETVQSAGWDSRREYRSRYREVPGLPAHPQRTYPEWEDWAAFLGTHERLYLSYRGAVRAVRREGFRTREEYFAGHRRVPGLPGDPARLYAGAWEGWAAFLGTVFLSLAAASTAARAADIRSRAEYQARYRSVPGLPSDPRGVYAGEWSGWTDFLGTNPAWLRFDEARRAVQASGWRTEATYRLYRGQIPGLPSNPDQTYAGEWTSWGDFLGTGRTRIRRGSVLPFAQLRTRVHTLKLGSPAAYRARARQGDLPVQPERDPAWAGWEDFLGVTLPEQAAFLTYQEARAEVRTRGWRTARAYTAKYREVPGLPSTPSAHYDEWTGWPDFLGERPPRFLEYEAASKAARAAGIRSFREYWARYTEVPGLPSTPNTYYPEWAGWSTFLGTAEPPQSGSVEPSPETTTPD